MSALFYFNHKCLTKNNILDDCRPHNPNTEGNILNRFSLQTQVLRMFLVYSVIQALAVMCQRLMKYKFLKIKDYEKIH